MCQIAEAMSGDRFSGDGCACASAGGFSAVAEEFRMGSRGIELVRIGIRAQRLLWMNFASRDESSRELRKYTLTFLALLFDDLDFGK